MFQREDSRDQRRENNWEAANYLEKETAMGLKQTVPSNQHRFLIQEIINTLSYPPPLSNPKPPLSWVPFLEHTYNIQINFPNQQKQPLKQLQTPQTKENHNLEVNCPAHPYPMPLLNKEILYI